MTKCSCCDYEEEAEFFHSKCCGVHFEGRIINNKFYIACEKCGRISGELK